MSFTMIDISRAIKCEWCHVQYGKTGSQFFIPVCCVVRIKNKPFSFWDLIDIILKRTLFYKRSFPDFWVGFQFWVPLSLFWYVFKSVSKSGTDFLTNFNSKSWSISKMDFKAFLYRGISYIGPMVYRLSHCYGRWGWHMPALCQLHPPQQWTILWLTGPIYGNQR